MNDGHGMGVQVFEYLNVLFHKGGGKMVTKGEAAAGEMPIHRSRQFCVMAGVAAGYSVARMDWTNEPNVPVTWLTGIW